MTTPHSRHYLSCVSRAVRVLLTRLFLSRPTSSDWGPYARPPPVREVPVPYCIPGYVPFLVSNHASVVQLPTTPPVGPHQPQRRPSESCTLSWLSQNQPVPTGCRIVSGSSTLSSSTKIVRSPTFRL